MALNVGLDERAQGYNPQGFGSCVFKSCLCEQAGNTLAFQSRRDVCMVEDYRISIPLVEQLCQGVANLDLKPHFQGIVVYIEGSATYRHRKSFKILK
jgi:hypothetical protein